MASIKMIPAAYPEPLLVGLSRRIPQHLYNGSNKKDLLVSTAIRAVPNQTWLPPFMINDAEFTNMSDEASMPTDTRTLLLHDVLSRGFPVVDTEKQVMPPYGKLLTYKEALKVVEEYAQPYCGVATLLYFIGFDQAYYLIGTVVEDGVTKNAFYNVRSPYLKNTECLDEDEPWFMLVE